MSNSVVSKPLNHEVGVLWIDQIPRVYHLSLATSKASVRTGSELQWRVPISSRTSTPWSFGAVKNLNSQLTYTTEPPGGKCTGVSPAARFFRPLAFNKIVLFIKHIQHRRSFFKSEVRQTIPRKPIIHYKPPISHPRSSWSRRHTRKFSKRSSWETDVQMNGRRY